MGKYIARLGAVVVGPLVIVILIFRNSCTPLPAAKVTIGVHAEDFKKPVRSAMKIMNRFVGCEFLIAGSDVRILSTDGEPCGEAFHRSIEDGHSAGTYRCDDGKFEVHIEKPVNVHAQVCIVGHEIGHVAGLDDHKVRGLKGIMNQYNCPTPISLSGLEVDFLREKFCE